VSANPPPRGFQTVVAPTDIPSTLPPVDLSQPALDPRNFAGRGVEGGVAWGVAGGTGPADQTLMPPGPAGDAVYAATLDDARFEPARLVSQPTPRYPRTMEMMAVPGRVMIQFIIDTTGGVELRSIEVVQSTHEAFEAPARESVAGALFRPARLGALPVRQLTRQPISFAVRQ
jgi:TonB family protein